MKSIFISKQKKMNRARIRKNRLRSRETARAHDRWVMQDTLFSLPDGYALQHVSYCLLGAGGKYINYGFTRPKNKGLLV